MQFLKFSLAALFLLSLGCKVVSVRLPEEFQGKKQKEDPPPYTGADPSPWAPAPEEGEKKP